ncbi:hypothetical protein [Bacteroides heparinolyticus]|uniref:hypothetical protein n=1 Tax=Prevotella heparinolytica TaxID=28113 RepID=UPI0035A04575
MKTRIAYVWIAALFVGSLTTVSAQEKKTDEKKQPPTQEEMVKMQAGRKVKELLLDDATAAKFTPLYEKYLTELNATCPFNAKKGKKTEGTETREDVKKELTDAEISQMLKDRFAQERKVLDIREKYFQEFSKILSPRQLLKVYQPKGHLKGQKGMGKFDQRGRHDRDGKNRGNGGDNSSAPRGQR